MNLYLAAEKPAYLQVDWASYTMPGVKVVACPFCGVSASNEGLVTITSCVSCLLFQCLTCQKAACAVLLRETIEKKEVEKIYPHDVIADNAAFYVSKLYKIESVSCSALRKFTSTEDIPNDDVLAFYNDLEKFGCENKIDVHKIGSDIADTFLKDNELAKKYKIEYTPGYSSRHLVLHINDYSLSNNPFRCSINVVVMTEIGARGIWADLMF